MTPEERDLLQQAAKALTDCALSVLTVRPRLEQPYPEAPEWTPYTRWLEQPVRNAHDLAITIREHLKKDAS